MSQNALDLNGDAHVAIAASAVVPERYNLSPPRSRFSSWSIVAIAAVAAHLGASVILRDRTRDICCAGINFSLLVVAAGVTTHNALLSKQSIRLFWAFLAAAYWMWALPPCVWFYYTVLHGTAPSFLLMTFPWFLHIVLMIAAAAARPHLKLRNQRPYAVTLNFLMVLFLLVFAYAYLLFPYGSVRGFPVVMRRFAALYSAENLALLIVLYGLAVRSQSPWRKVYWHLFGASALYAAESEFAHLVFASNGRFTDGLVAVLFTGATAWFVWISVQGQRFASELAKTVQLDTSDRRSSTLLATIAVVSIPLVGVFELVRSDGSQARLIRLLIVLISAALLATVAFFQDYLSNRELASDVNLANERLRLALESGKSAVWDWDVKTGLNSLAGDLESLFGIPSAGSGGEIQDLRSYLHPEDREQVSNAIRAAIRDYAPYSGEFRILRRDQTIRSVAVTGRCYYAPDGQPERMLGVVVDVTERRQAEQKLRESEKRFLLVAENAPVMIWMCDDEGRITYRNKQRVVFIGTDRIKADAWTGWVHPDDLNHVRDSLARSLKNRQPFSDEYRLRRHDGVYRWMLDIASPRTNADGTFAGLIGSTIDITDQKLARQALETVSCRLIEAQEKERTRIARELHDDICQRLALLSMEMERASRSQDGSGKFLEKIRAHCIEIANDVQSMSHELHSSKLEYLGIVAAIRGFCREFAKQHEVNIAFSERNIPSLVPRDVSLCLFRVAQEALHNAIKYSGASRFAVELNGVRDELHLEVRDSGVGFDQEAIGIDRGLGLVSMQERVHQVHGHFRVESKLGVGTRVVAVVPVVLAAEEASGPGDRSACAQDAA